MIRLFRSSLLTFLLFNVLLLAGAQSLGAQTPVRQLVYEARVNGHVDIFLLDVDHRLVYNLTNNPGDDSRPAWSPDGSKIAFESWRNVVRAVYVMDADGTNVRRVSADAGASEYDPQWTLDGSSVVFRSYRRHFGGETTVTVYRASPDGSHLQMIDPSFEVRVRSFDRFISQRFVDGEWGIYLTEGDSTRWLRDSSVVFRENPRWSPDDSLIAFLSQGRSGESEVYIMDADGSNLRQITMDGLPKSNLSWRP